MFMQARLHLMRLGEQKTNAGEIYKAAFGRFKKKMKKFRKQYKSADFSDPDFVHSLRIQGKKLHYSLQLLSDGGVEHLGLLEQLKQLQKMLGGICDTNNFLRMVGELKAEGPGSLPEDFVLQETGRKEDLKKQTRQMRL